MKNLFLSILILSFLNAGSKPRARDLGIPFDGNPGPFNAITDVAGDIFIVFSTANPNVAFANKKVDVEMLPNWMISSLFEATVQAVEESIINVLCAAEDLEGINDNKVWALPQDRLVEVMKKYNRLNK